MERLPLAAEIIVTNLQFADDTDALAEEGKQIEALVESLD